MMSIDWQILEETKKKSYRRGLWRGIIISIIIATAVYLFLNLILTNNKWREYVKKYQKIN